MEARLVEFAEILRQNGLRVSTAEVVDAACAMAAVGLADRDQLRAVLRTTLCKREQDVELFSQVFELYFSGVARTFQALDASLLKRIEEQGLLEGDELAMVVATVNRLAGQLHPLTDAALSGDRARLAQIFRSATLQLDLTRIESSLQNGFFSRRLLAASGGEQLRRDLSAMEAELQARGLSARGVEIVSSELAEALRRVEQAARREVDRQSTVRRRPGRGALADRHLSQLSQVELQQVQQAVRQLALKLKSRLTRKRRSRRRGALHVRRTLRKNLSLGGMPMSLAFRDKRPERPEVLVLCDISDSVRTVSRLMLLFTYTLQSLFARVRSFVFVSDLGEVTAHFRDLEVEDAIEEATSGRAVSRQANSNYGRALSGFARSYLGSVNRRTTVLIIGDGRNNYNPAELWALKDLRRKAKRVLWICTEDRKTWAFGDSEMASYSRHCHQVVTVQSLDDLSRLADQLLPE